ncbi:hypothetical protein [Amycolatopsis sp. cmx-4-68]|uniref:hypothetical protein n=1 Tax=Amycolatopsis sp. cmx-4-68 TaxID=2790938 RepID=UPI00397C6990
MVTVIPGTPHPAAPHGDSVLPYPTAEDEKIRRYAELIGADPVIKTLDQLRIFVLGDLGKVLTLADRFAHQTKLTEAAAAISDAQLELATAWQGDGYAQFDKYAGLTVTALGKGQDGIVKLTGTMTSVAKTVLDTYKLLIGFIGNCAATLAQVSGKAIIAFLSAPIPVINAIEAKDVVDIINTALSTFMRDCNNALQGMITNIGNLVGSGLEFTTIESNFPKVPPVGASAEVIDNPKRWHLKPEADPS